MGFTQRRGDVRHVEPHLILPSFAPDRRPIRPAERVERGPGGRHLRRDQKGVMRAKPTSYRHHVTRHGDAGNVIGLRGRQVSRELRRDIDLSGGDVRQADGSV